MIEATGFSSLAEARNKSPNEIRTMLATRQAVIRSPPC